ncbi:MAG TPA: YciI family protein [bacterium]|nr:YciI family protein [bacterium]
MYVLIGYDAPNGQELRKLHREAHLEKLRALARAGKIVAAGPFTDGSGSLIVFDVATKTEVELIAKTDPYVMHRVFERYEIKPFEKVLP